MNREWHDVEKQLHHLTTYKKIDDLRIHLQEELQDFSDITDPNDACEKLIQTYSSGISRYSRTYEPSRKNTAIKPWISPGILASINRKKPVVFIKKQL